MNIITDSKNNQPIMRQTLRKQKLRLVTRAAFLALCALIFAMPAKAQTKANEFRMKTGNQTISDNVVYNFYDSGGPYVMTPEEDPNNDYNWVSWYQHNESFLLHLINPLADQDKGIKLIFNYLLINNDHLKIYEGDIEDESKLIVDLTNNDYSTGYGNGFSVISHGNMTLRFESDYHWRDAGWEALVELYDYKPQAPIALMAACENTIELLPGSMAETGETEMFYTIDGTTPDPIDINDPLASTKKYTAPFAITSAPTTVKTLLVEGTASSEVASYVFTNLITAPAKPEIRHVPNTNTVIITAPAVPSDINDTYYVRYSIDGSDPGYSDLEQAKADTIELTQPGLVRAVTRGTTCPDLFSVEDSLRISTIYVPMPKITITGTDETGTATITCSLAGATIYYTINGTDPTTTITTSGSSPITLSVPAGTTVKALAAHPGDAYVASSIATAIYIPGGDGGQGVYGSVVLLDDREDHNWSYYSDSLQPVHSLKPADVKITYFGNGITMKTNNDYTENTSANDYETSSGVAVGIDDTDANQFIYLKTLENAEENGSGNYPYTMIPNPFSKRPTFGTPSGNMTNFTGWRGFQGWRVKRLSGVTITGYSVGDIIPAETVIEFITNNAKGNEVDFEAVWARAYVGGSYSSNVGYERNFVIGGGAVNYPATYSALYPNGTTNGTTPATSVSGTYNPGGDRTLNYDSKFEYINLTGGRTFTANNHYLCFGRGISTSNTAAGTVRGISGNVGSQNDPTGLNYTIRLESGTISQLAFVKDNGTGGNNTVYGRVSVKAILGSDYDRAKNDNLRLSVSNNNTLFFTRAVAFASNSNKDQKVFDCVVKSGEFQKSYWDSDVNNFTYTNSMYCGANFNATTNTHYPGARYVTIEGGALGNINGGRGTGTAGNNDNPDATSPQTDAWKVSFSLRIKKDAVINGCVFGGAANTSAWGSKRIVVTGGEVLSWIAGGANGTNTTNGESRTRGTSYIYVGGNAKVGGQNAKTKNGTLGGQVFGAGRGNTNQAASMDTSYVVIADAAKIMKKNNDASGNVYGGGNIGYIHKASNVYILGGTIEGSVFGGAYGNALDIPKSTVVVKGGTVSGSVYGGSNSTGTVQNDSIYMSGGKVTNVYGGGLGASTRISGNAEVNIAGGTINNNVYGGGELGTVTGNTEVAVSGGTMKNIFGAGKGGSTTANIGATTTVTVSGGTIAESVYGGGQNGNVKQANNPAKGDPEGPRDITPVSTVNITGGTVTNNVFGGGSMGFTNGGTLVNMSGGTVEGSVFGGALGTKDKVYVAGQRTVNMRGGTINKHLYGGSRNADDALTFNPSAFSQSTDTITASVVNISGGYVHYQVFASGYFGNVFGSTYAFIGTNAILNAPHHVAGTAPYNADYYNQHQALRIGGSIWAGGDFGNYDGTKFGDPTITGRSDIFIDGEGYDTESNNTTATNYMFIGGSIYGSGTSCDAGKQGRKIILREYGKLIEASQPTTALPYSSATRALYSIQRADSLVIDNSHIVLLGEGKINSLVTTEKYSIHEFKLVRIANGSSIFLSAPAEQLMKFGSYKCENVYDNKPTYNKVTYATSSLKDTPNKIRVNDGCYINVYHDELEYKVNGVTMKGGYGELEGFAYMMSDNTNNTCAYARPKQSTDEGNKINSQYDNPNDGGFVSYDQNLNTFDADGGTVTSGGIQMPYENHTTSNKNGEQYFRIWRAGGTYSYREGVFVAQSNGTESFSTVDVVISLPAFENCEDGTAYYRIQSLDNNTTINYGTDVMTVNAACYGDVDDDDWMYINGTDENASFVTEQPGDTTHLKNLHFITENPNVNFGLVAIPLGGLVGNDDMLLCEASDPKIANMQWENKDNSSMPKVRFRLTYNNALTNNVVWDPITITFEQVNCKGNVTATVEVSLTVTTLTNINQEFITQAYAIMRGTGTANDTYTAKVVLPQYVMHVNTLGEISEWTCTDVHWVPENGFGNDCFVGGTNYLNSNPEGACNNKFGMDLVAGLNFDNSTGWETWEVNAKDMYGWNNSDYVFGATTARDPIGFDFTMKYDGRQHFGTNKMLGTLVFTMHFTNYEVTGDPWESDLTIKIEVWFLGEGANYYIDGVHGNNLYSGKYPNAAKKTLSGIYNRTNYHAGDQIFIVDTITASGSKTLTWNGKAYNEVTLFRYPGGHECVPNAPNSESHYEDYDLENNACYQGPLVTVKDNMIMTGIVLDGFNEESKKDPGTAAGDQPGYNHTYQPANAPLVEILEGGKLSVYGSSRLENNYNATTDGGGVYIANGGTLNIYDGSAIDTNYVSSGKNGGGVYVNSTSVLQLSDKVTINGNKKGIENSIDNNVYLSTYDSYVNVGTADTEDPYTMLLADSRIGITKNNNWRDYWYAPVAYSDGGQHYLSNLIGSGIMWDDETKYGLVSLNQTHLNPPTDYLYFVGTWVTEVTKNPQNENEPDNFNASIISTPQELAWLISYVNGLNGATAHPNAAASLIADIDMNANIWVPIINYAGTFNGNGHVVTGLRSPMNQENMGMFGNTNNATITDVVAQANFAGGTMKNIGTLIGTMKGGSLNNVEAGGTLTGTTSTVNMGGLVGASSDNAMIHSGFAVNTMTGGNTTTMGGLVGSNGGNLYNSYSNTTITGTIAGGLVGVNNGNIENCYAVVGEQTFPAFANTNNGAITICYADTPNEYVASSGSDATLTGHGTYDKVKGRKEIGYMYYDNFVEAENNYVADTINYDNNHISTWPGMLSSLNQWVKAKSNDNITYTSWLRPTSADINGDLPVLCFNMDNSMASVDGKFLHYGSIHNNVNGIDNLLATFNDNSQDEAEPTANIFLYGNAIDVANVPSDNVNVFINEDAVLLQKQGAKGAFINTTVGISFDNSCKSAVSTGDPSMPLNYDWHLMSSPLSNAPMGLSWSDGQVNWWNTQNWNDAIGQVTGVSGSYLPDGTDAVSHWDFYTYYEPQYHWINFKRNSSSHAHYEEPHDWISYTNETNLVPGKGYMAAIDQDSYLSNTGTLNNGDVPIKLTYSNDGTGLEAPTKDWGSNLVGNPYQAYLDLNAVAEGTGYTRFYIYSAETNQYVPFTKGQSSNTWTPSQFIHPHQAFFVLTNATDGNFKFTYDMATASKDENGNSYFRKGAQIDYPLINLFAKDEAGALNYTIIEVGRPELGGAEKTEALKTTNFDLYAHYGQQDYKLLFTPEEAQRVAVFFSTKKDGTYTLNWDTQNGEFNFLRLIDNITGVEVDMLNNDHYTFEGHASDYASRFYILFNNPNEEPGGNGNGNGNGEIAYFDGYGWIVNGEGFLELIDVTGRVLYRQYLAGDMNRVQLDNFKTGVYVLKLGDMTQKIIIK